MTRGERKKPLPLPLIRKLGERERSRSDSRHGRQPGRTQPSREKRERRAAGRERESQQPATAWKKRPLLLSREESKERIHHPQKVFS